MHKLLPAVAVAMLVTAPILLAKRPQFMDSVRPLAQEGMNGCTVSSIHKDKHYFLTAAHCVADHTPSGDVHINYGRTIDGKRATPIFIDLPHDLAVLVAEDTDVPDLKLANDNLDYGDPVMIAGHPLGWSAIILVQGTVVSPFVESGQNKWMLFDITIAHGNSGSPVVNKNGEIVSVLQAGWGHDIFSRMNLGPTQDVLRESVGKYFRRK